MSQFRYSFGGDEHLFVEVSEDMSLESFFRGMAACTELRRMNVQGLTETCPANASFLLRFNPDEIAPDELLDLVKGIESRIEKAPKVLDTRIVEIPVLYNDPWTHETLMRFRERHQDPNSTDLEYAARINGLESVDAFIAAHSGSPWFVSMVGFVAGLPFLYQMVERDKQMQVPKYVRPRTDTPKLTVGQGGCFGCVYSVRGAGGYQMFGVTPVPIFDPEQKQPHLKEFMCFFKPGDIVKWKPITREEYDRDLAAVEAGTFHLNVQPVRFSLDEFQADPAGTNQRLMEALHA